MKRFIILAITILILIASALAADTSQLLAQFKARYPDATDIQYKMTGDFFSILFVQNGVKMNIFYNEAGDQVAISRVINYNTLPPKSQAAMQNRYKGYTPAETIEMNHSMEGTAWYVSLENPQWRVIVMVSLSGDVSLFKKTKK